MNFCAKGHILGSFFQFQELEEGTWINHKHLPLNKYFLDQATHKEPALMSSIHKFRRIHATSQLVIWPSPPSFLGMQTSFDLTFDPLTESSWPSHKKAEHTC